MEVKRTPRKRTHRLAQEKEVLESVMTTGRTIQGIADHTGLQYYTVRRVVNDLFHKNKIKVEGYHERAAIYIYNLGAESQMDFIPRILDHIAGESIKMNGLVDPLPEQLHKIPESKTVKAVRRVPYWAAMLLEVANRAAKLYDVKAELDYIRRDMQRDYLQINAAAKILEQMLSEPTLQDVNGLADMTDDIEYSVGKYMEVIKAYEEKGWNK